MKTILLVFALAMQINFSYSQSETYTITNIGTSYTAEQINSAFTDADLCGLFYSNERRKIKMKDGAVIELLMTSELNELDNSCATQKDLKRDNEQWGIDENGYLYHIYSLTERK